MIFSGVVTIIANVFFVFVMDSFTKIQWVDKYGKFQTITIDPSFLFLMAFSKIIMGGYFIYKQGRETLNVVNPILKEYRHAEAGITQGIPMTNNHSEKLQALKKTVWKITFAMIFVMFLTLLVFKAYAQNKVSEFISLQYKNSTDADFSIDLFKTLNTKKTFMFVDDKYLEDADYWVDDKIIPADEVPVVPTKEEEKMIEEVFPPTVPPVITEQPQILNLTEEEPAVNTPIIQKREANKYHPKKPVFKSDSMT